MENPVFRTGLQQVLNNGIHQFSGVLPLVFISERQVRQRPAGSLKLAVVGVFTS